MLMSLYKLVTVSNIQIPGIAVLVHTNAVAETEFQTNHSLCKRLRKQLVGCDCRILEPDCG